LTGHDPRAEKSGADNAHRLDFDLISIAIDTPLEDLLSIDETLEKLATEYPDCAALIKLRFFAGLSQQESAKALGIRSG
jgi:DNA-directed RNA polymerase specialized sigma24 family protein